MKKYLLSLLFVPSLLAAMESIDICMESVDICIVETIGGAIEWALGENIVKGIKTGKNPMIKWLEPFGTAYIPEPEKQRLEREREEVERARRSDEAARRYEEKDRVDKQSAQQERADQERREDEAAEILAQIAEKQRGQQNIAIEARRLEGEGSPSW